MRSSHKCNRRGMFHSPVSFTLLLLITMLSAGCGGGGGGGGSSNNDGTSTPSPNTAQLTLVADAGGICETLLQGTRASAPVVCNNGSDPYTAYLDGSKSTTSGDKELSYAWSFIYKPAGSNAKLVGANTVNPTFMPDVAGSYAVQLVVSSLGVSSPRAVALVVALDDATLNPDFTTQPTARNYFFHGGLSNNCSLCHSGKYPTLQAKSGTHIATSNMCQSCHSPTGFVYANFVDHTEVFGNCSDCHDGVIATGKSAGHIDTTQECSDCHTTTSFLTLNADGTYDHTKITAPCSTCHNGATAIGTDSAPNPPGHPTVSVECNNCHTTDKFGTPFVNHSKVTPGTCGQAGCHGPGASLGKSSAPYPHPDTGDITDACDLCHNTTTFNLDGVFDHDVLARHPIACNSCHDGLNATGMIAGHITTSPGSDCSDCHHTSSFVGGFVDHTSTEVTSKACTDCHDGTTAPGAPTTADGYPQALETIHTDAVTAGKTCSDCHSAGGSFSLAKVDHSGFGTLLSPNLSIDCNSCHDGTTALGKPVGHQVTMAQCSTCHDPQADTFAGGTYDHSDVNIVGSVATPTCVSCHDGTAHLGQSMTHVPLPTQGQDCLVCHGTGSGFSSFAVQTFDHAAAGITDNCASCHDGLPHDGVVVISTPSDHIPSTNDCSTCHTDTTNGPSINGTNLSGFTNAAPFVNTVHPAYSTGCSNCHNGVYDNSVYGATFYSSPRSSTHKTADSNSWDCGACHTTTGAFAETNPVNHQDPNIKAQQCVSCHVDGNTVQPVGKGAIHPATSNTCQDCHQAGGSFSSGFDHTTLNTGGVNHGLACATCHDGLNAKGKIANHLPTTRDCGVCHTEYPPTVPSFAGGQFDHTGPEMSGRQCMDCHDNNIVPGKSASHLATNQDCGTCHTTSGTFASNATGGFDHTGVTDGCAASGCHAAGTTGVVDATDDPNPLPHIPIVGGSGELNCYSCHKSAGGTFANAAMDHTVVTSTACQSCHDGNHDGSNAAHVVTTKSSNHFVTSIAACSSCHTSTSSWGVAVTDYTHIANGGYPGNHSSRRISSCDQCHDSSPPNADISGFPHATYGTACAACHASDGTRKHGSPLRTKYYDCGNCHSVSKSGW
jgi:hypothetical protein